MIAWGPRRSSRSTRQRSVAVVTSSSRPVQGGRLASQKRSSGPAAPGPRSTSSQASGSASPRGEDRTRKAASELRLELGNSLGLRNPADYKPLWVLDFPLLEPTDEEGHWAARHHPFTAPKPEHIELLKDRSRYGEIKANAYDIVLNGTEIGGGSIRIYRRELQEQMFDALGMSREEAAEQFGFLLGAFEYGAPPHGGIAFGFDRLCALLGGQETIRDFIAFPKNNAGRDVMLDAPAAVNEKQLQELKLKTL